jgi:hypothetical protein
MFLGQPCFKHTGSAVPGAVSSVTCVSCPSERPKRSRFFSPAKTEGKGANELLITRTPGIAVVVSAGDRDETVVGANGSCQCPPEWEVGVVWGLPKVAARMSNDLLDALLTRYSRPGH